MGKIVGLLLMPLVQIAPPFGRPARTIPHVQVPLHKALTAEREYGAPPLDPDHTGCRRFGGVRISTREAFALKNPDNSERKAS